MNPLYALGARWIWLPEDGDSVNRYAWFRHEFTLGEDDAGEAGRLCLSADTDYAVWINGQWAGFNQYDDYPWNKAYDVLDVGRLLLPGPNELRALVYYQGVNSFQYMKGRPGLIYALEAGSAAAVSGPETLCKPFPAYRNGDMEKITGQMGFSFHYDARLGDGQESSGSWKRARIREEMTDAVSLYERPNRKLVLDPDAAGRIVAQGFFRRGTGTGEADGLTTAQLMQQDYLSARRAEAVFGTKIAPELPCAAGIPIAPPPPGDDGVYLIVDLGREEAGLFTLELDGEEGVRVEAAYGEHLDDLRVRARIGSRNFAFSYICRAGLQRFTHYFKRIAGRYVQLHISGLRQGAALYYAGMRPARYPLMYRGEFSCGDRLMNRIGEVSRRTLELCMHEHYEDTPWREQALYAMDSRNQALCGYYCFGEYDFPQSAFSLFAENIGDDGLLEICAPARDRITIPSFSMAWVMAVRDWALFSGRTGEARGLMPAVRRILEAAMARMEGGLLRTPEGSRYWNFYEWADGLDDALVFSNPLGRSRGRLDAPLNLFFCLALEAGAQLARWTGDAGAEGWAGCLQTVRAAFHPAFWDRERGVYRTYMGGGETPHYAELTQALALLGGVVPPELAGGVRARLAGPDDSLVATTLSYALYKYEALLQEPGLYATAVFDDIARQWGHMLYQGATSFWETIRGADDFDQAGSLSHGWSAIPLYFYYAYLLGVRPLEPGFARYTSDPLAGIVDRVSGKVPTPRGVIPVG